MRGNDFGVAPPGDVGHSTIHGSGWTPERDQPPPLTTSSPAVAAPAERGTRRRTGLVRIGLAGVIGIVIVIATFLAASNALSLLYSQPHYVPVGKGIKHHVKLVGPSRAARIVTIGACLGVDALATSGLILLWRRRPTPVPPPIPSHRAPAAAPPTGPPADRAPRSMRHWIVLTLLALLILTSFAAILLTQLSGSHYTVLAAFAGTPVLLGAFFVFVQMCRRKNRVRAGDVRGGRLWSHDEQGNLLPALPLELRGRVRRSIAEGDRVEVRGWWNERRKVFLVESVHNRTTNLRVNRDSLLMWLAVPGILLLIVGQFAGVAAGQYPGMGLRFVNYVGGLLFLLYVVSALRSDRSAQ
jgi:hypothetical protein